MMTSFHLSITASEQISPSYKPDNITMPGVLPPELLAKDFALPSTTSSAGKAKKDNTTTELIKFEI